MEKRHENRCCYSGIVCGVFLFVLVVVALEVVRQGVILDRVEESVEELSKR